MPLKRHAKNKTFLQKVVGVGNKALGFAEHSLRSAHKTISKGERIYHDLAAPYRQSVGGSAALAAFEHNPLTGALKSGLDLLKDGLHVGELGLQELQRGKQVVRNTMIRSAQPPVNARLNNFVNS